MATLSRPRRIQAPAGSKPLQAVNRRSTTIGFFGRAGSFSEVATARRFPQAARRECPTISDAFARLEAGEFSRIVVPIENASSGLIVGTADHLMRLALPPNQEELGQIREMLAMRIELALLARPGTRQLLKIYSHSAPFEHSRDWLARHHPGAELIAVASTAEAAKRAAAEAGAGAIAGRQAAVEYKLAILSRAVGGEVANRTAFAVVGAPLRRPLAPTHTTLLFELPHAAGSLVAALRVLSRRQINLTKIISRPIPGRFEEYRFLVEMAGAEPAPAITAALRDLRRCTTLLAQLGAYPIRKI